MTDDSHGKCSRNRKNRNLTGGGTKFINKRDKDFVLSRMSKDINDRVDILKNKQRIPYSDAKSKDLAISNCGGGRCNGKKKKKNDVCL